MSNNKTLKSWDQKDLFNQIHRVLKRKFGKVPKKGVIAGQAVASAVFEVVGLGVEGPYKDIDLFIEKDELEALQDTLMTKLLPGKRERELLRQLRSPRVIEKTGLETTAGKFEFVTDSHDIGQYEEDRVNILRTQSSSYRIKRVFDPRDDYPLNVIEIEVSKTNDVSNIEAIVAGFDFNLTQVGIDLSSKEVFWTQEFEQFLFRPEIKVSNFKTPVGSALRLMEKLEIMPWLECDLDDNLAKLRDARWIANEYEQNFVLSQDIPGRDLDSDDDDVERKQNTSWEINGQSFNITSVTEERNAQFGHVKIIKLSSGNDPRTRKIPGVRLSEGRASRWLKYEDTLSKYFEVSGNPKTLIEKTIIDSGENDIDGPGYFDGKKVVHESAYQIFECLPRYDSKLENSWQNIFGKDLINKKYFFNALTSSSVSGKLGGLERIFSDMNWVNRLAESKDKEAKARVRLIKEVLVPKISEELDRIEGLEGQEDSYHKIQRAFSEDSLLSPMILARLLVSRENDMKFNGLQPKTFEKYMRNCIQENLMLVAITEPQKDRDRMFKNFSFLKKNGELGIFASPLETSKLTLRDLLLLGKEELRRTIDTENKYLAKQGVAPLFKDAKLKNGYQVKELCTARDLKERGKSEDHCVSGYMTPVKDGQSIILKIDNKESRSRSTAEIVLRGKTRGSTPEIKVDVVQHRSRANGPADEENKKILESWVSAFQNAVDLALEGKQNEVHDYWKNAIDSILIESLNFNRTLLESMEKIQPYGGISLGQYKPKNTFSNSMSMAG